LTGGDLVATAAVVGGAALAVGGAAVAGVGALAGGGSAAAGTGSAASAGGAGSSTTTAVANVGSVGAGSSAGGGSVSPPLSQSPSSSTNDGGMRRQLDPPSNGSGDGGAADQQGVTPRMRGNTMHGENVSSGTMGVRVPPLASSALSSIGGGPLEGSGFETQPAQRGFTPASVSAGDAVAAPIPALSSPSTARTAPYGDAVASCTG
jgi:hypothetical protein